MFDPFNDFETKGYLHNVRRDKNQRDIKRFEHDLFEANIDTALAYLAACTDISYQEFLEVHRILFSDYYPWAGQDRAAAMPNGAVIKGDVRFSHPQSSQLAVEHGLRLGQDAAVMVKKPGEVMGLFAYGHPFLDGNGRTMLLVHMELCHRAGFSIEWHKTNKADYLAALSQEINSPGNGILDGYLLEFKKPRLARDAWGSSILNMTGLDGLDSRNQIDGDLSDPAVAEKYKQLEAQRGYTYAIAPSLAQQWNAEPGKYQCSGRILALSSLEVIQDAGRSRRVVWDRSKLQDNALCVDESVTIHENGTVVRAREKGQGLGR